MKVVETVKGLRQQVTGWRNAGELVALVPTMGNLHLGHLELVTQARQQADRVVVTIFINPMQFGEGEDFSSYPRTLEQDCAQLVKVGADLLFNPSVDEVYPHGQEQQTVVTVPLFSAILCGATRPDHFAGVATVVCKLLNMVQADLALFGEKDFQQLLVIRRMAEDLCIPIEIVGVPTVREENGLAMSSRNGYLTPKERGRAPLLYRILNETAAAIEADVSDFTALEQEGERRLTESGFIPDYYSIRRAADLSEPDRDEQYLVILAAARLGHTRLIDNLQVMRRIR
ncbi:Pantoate--beta-alanine ligase [hydrothermal vent metagenome]|uniref:pantoate--beta-alanine ligase (AMP-forming) n=1 Tax=hydrothermal vent metagenome TaxID=652676 RepID=A0A3B1B892_9ZZZZ